MKKVLIQSVDRNYLPLIDITRENTLRYCERHQVFYQLSVGLITSDLPPAWNRIPLILGCLAAGFETIVWLDADCVIVDHTQNIFMSLPPAKSISMAQFSNVKWNGIDHYNTGVMIIKNTEDVKNLFSWVWKQRYVRLPHHYPKFWEQNFILDYLTKINPDMVAPLDHSFNYIDGLSNPNIRPVIKGYHGRREACLPLIKKDLAENVTL